MPRGDHDHRLTFAPMLRQVYKRFQDEHGNANGGVILKQDDMLFMGVRMELEHSYDPKQLRGAIEQMLDAKPMAILQVVGDSSGGFTLPGIQAIQDTLSSAVRRAHSAGFVPLLEYGYTASVHDTNWAVNDFLALPENHDVKALGNLVSASGKAIEDWGCEATAKVNHFVLGYSHGETDFGADMWLSDSIMIERDRDEVICADGGPQTFRQVATACAAGIRVIIITGSSMRKDGLARFSAAGLLRVLCNRFEQRESANYYSTTGSLRDDLEDAALQYVDRYSASLSTQSGAKYHLITQGLEKLFETPASLAGVLICEVDDMPV